jgi:hypothetical protein
MYFGDTETRIEGQSSSWQGRCNIKTKHKERNPYTDINGIHRNQGYIITFEIEILFSPVETLQQETIRKLINEDSVCFYPRYFEEYVQSTFTYKPVSYDGKLVLKSENLEKITDTLKLSLTAEVEEIQEKQQLVEGQIM